MKVEAGIVVPLQASVVDKMRLRAVLEGSI